MARPRGLLVIALAALAVSDRAWANAAAPFVLSPGNQGGAFIAQPTALLVEHEALDFRCDASACEFKAAYTVRNPSDAREEVLGAFYGIETDRFAATVDGADARHPLTAPQRAAIDDAVAVFDPNVARDQTVAREGFVLGVKAHARATLIFSGRMHPSRLGLGWGGVVGELGLAPLEARHLWLGTPARQDMSNGYTYALSPIRNWAGAASIDVTVRCASARLWTAGQEGWTAHHDDAGFVARRTLAARDATSLSFWVVATPGTNLIRGGPIAGAGGRLNPGGFRARLGYEAADPWWVIWSASVETDFKATTTIIPLIELATPDILVLIPSLGLGVGVPIQLRSGAGTRVGARMQLTVSFPVVSLVFPVDVFPGAASNQIWQLGLFGQASF